MNACHLGEDGFDFFGGEDGGEVLWAFGADGINSAIEFLVQDVAIEKNQGAEGLILGGSRDLAINGEVAEKGFNLWNAHFLWVAFIMKQNVTTNPLSIGFFGTIGVVFEPNLVFNLL
jgi:hypothetical protein